MTHLVPYHQRLRRTGRVMRSVPVRISGRCVSTEGGLQDATLPWFYSVESEYCRLAPLMLIAHTKCNTIFTSE